MKKLVIAMTLALGLAFVTFGAATKGGANYKKAVSLGGTMTVKTVQEVDPDDGEIYEGSYVAWLKFTAKRGNAYTVLVTRDGSEEQADCIFSYVDDESMWIEKSSEVYLPWFSSDTDPDGLSDRHILYAEDWDDDPEYGHAKSGTYFLCIESGESSQEVKVQLINGEQQYEWPKGSEENPVAIKPAKDAATYSGKLSLGGEFHFETSSLLVDHRYDFWTTGGTEGNELVLSAGAVSVAEPRLQPYVAEGQSAYDDGISVIPTEKGKCKIVVAGMAGLDGKSFTLHYVAVPFRNPADHSVKASFADIAATPQTAACQPGNRNKKGSKYWDRTIDTSLYRVSLKKGKRYVFSTEGANTNLLMEVYDESGAALLANRRGFADDARKFDCRIVYKAAATADYWVGVCQDLENDGAETATAGACTFAVQELTAAMTVKDACDSADDTYAGATLLNPGIAEKAKQGTATEVAHTLGATDLVDYYVFDATAGLDYRFQAVRVDKRDNSAAAFRLKATVCSLVDGALVVRESFDDLAAGIRFRAPESGSYYLKVEESSGCGVDYGAHQVWSAVWTKGGGLGYLDVRIGGATTAEGAGWAVDSKDAGTFAAAGVYVMPVAGSYKLKFAEVEGWTAPAGVKSKAVVTGATTVVTAKYSDAHDAADLAKDATDGDGAYGAPKRTKLKPAAEEQSERRSLWKNDPADWYYFKSEAYTRYVLKLQDAVGDVALAVENKTDKKTLQEKGTVAEVRTEEKDKTIAVKAYHGTAACADSQYALVYSGVQVGKVGFTASSFSVKDNADSVTLTVERTKGKSGAVSVRYTTESGSGETGAVANENYVPTSGTLTWKDGEEGQKKITVKLLPQLRAGWDESRTFKVKLEGAADAAAGTEAPFLGKSSAKVQIKPTNKQVVGTVQFVTKSLSTPAGEKVQLWLQRTGGDDGEVGVKVKTSDSSAKNGVDYRKISKTVTWANGDSEDKCVDLQTLFAGDGKGYQKTRKLTVKISEDKTQPYAVKIGKTAKMTVSLTDPNVTRTFADFQAAAKELDGVTVKAGASETWYFDRNGTFRSVTPGKDKSATLTLTFKGTGKFAFTPTFENGGSSKNTVTCKVDKKSVSLKNGQRVIKYLKDGEHTVEFAVSQTKTVSGDVSLSFANDEDSGMPFLWKPLPKAEVASPLSGAAVRADGALGWTVDDDASEVVTLLTVATSKDNLGKQSKALVFERRNDPGAAASVALAEVGCKSGKTYYWRVDSVFVDADGVEKLRVTGSVWKFNTCAADAPATLFAKGAADVFGQALAKPAAGMPYEVRLVQGVKAAISLAFEDSADGKASYSYKLVAGKLPTGVSLSGSGKLSKAPTKVGTYDAALQVIRSVTTGKGKSAKTVTTAGATLPVRFVVAPIGLAAGAFKGLVVTEDERVADLASAAATALGALEIGAVDVSVTSEGEITAKVKVGGETYKFSGSGYDRGVTEQYETGLENFATVKLTKKTKVKYKNETKSATVTNVLELTSCCAAPGETGAYSRFGLDCPMSVKLRLSVPAADDKSVCRNVEWVGHALRDNTKIADELSRIAQFAGYYTVSLDPGINAIDGMSGCGYLTMTVSEKGVAKVAGLLADGKTEISASAVCGFRSVQNGEPADELLVPVCSASAKTAFGGWLRLRLGGDGVPFVATWVDDPVNATCGIGLRMINPSAKATLDGEAGYRVVLDAVGGYYDTVVNLQRHYWDLGAALVVPELDLIGLSDYLLSGSYTEFVGYPGCGSAAEEALAFNDDKLSVAKQVLKYRKDNAKLIDFVKSTNASGLSLAFKRATGVYTGSFELWKGNDVAGEESKQKKIGTFGCAGVLLLTRDEEAPVSFEDNAAPGFYNVVVGVTDDAGKKREVTTSYPFVIAPREIDKPEEK